MILITTSRRPNQHIRTLCNDLSRVIPTSLRINRGKLNFEGIIDNALVGKADRLILVEKWKGGFGKINLYTISPEVRLFYPIIYLSSVKTQNDLGFRKTIRKRLAITIQQDNSKDIKRLAYALSKFIKLPIEPLQKYLPFQASIHFSSLQKSWIKIAITKPPILKEIGPIFIVKKLLWDTFEKNK
jgi:rRNA maturation protein Rpf1